VNGDTQRNGALTFAAVGGQHGHFIERHPFVHDVRMEVVRGGVEAVDRDDALRKVRHRLAGCMSPCPLAPRRIGLIAHLKTDLYVMSDWFRNPICFIILVLVPL